MSQRSAVRTRSCERPPRHAERTRPRASSPACESSRRRPTEAGPGTPGRRPGQSSANSRAARAPIAHRFDPHDSPAVRQPQRPRGVQCRDPAVDQKGHAVAQLVGGHHVVGRQENRRARRPSPRGSPVGSAAPSPGRARPSARPGTAAQDGGAARAPASAGHASPSRTRPPACRRLPPGPRGRGGHRGSSVWPPWRPANKRRFSRAVSFR